MDAWRDGFVRAPGGVKESENGKRRRKGIAIGHCIGVLGKEAISIDIR